MNNTINITLGNSIKCGAGSSMFLSFAYDPDLVKVVQAFPVRCWNIRSSI